MPLAGAGRQPPLKRNLDRSKESDLTALPTWAGRSAPAQSSVAK